MLYKFYNQKRAIDRPITRVNGPKVIALSDSDPIPSYLQELIDRYIQDGILSEQPYQISLNYYEDLSTMVKHTDGNRSSQVAILTLVGYAELEFYKIMDPAPLSYPHTCVWSDEDVSDVVGTVLMCPGSVLTMTGRAFSEYAHGISEIGEKVVNENMRNIDYTGLELGDPIPGGKRISVVMWNIGGVQL
eukprot:TRINITY_DN4140_c0_g1_i2.p1 TRINITY_DN4140_c0_g1~~TRINITY_DN4140_c0_g1_i2.p1  ORF type:complete len:189 (+),score=47.74 TRINITY_DN4140_c0_g1_i2:177-743(+)